MIIIIGDELIHPTIIKTRLHYVSKYIQNKLASTSKRKIET